MNINTSPDTINRELGQHHAGLYVRLRQQFRDRGAARRAAHRPQFAAALRLRALCGAVVRLAVHRAARQQRALLALSHPPVGQAFRAFRQGRCRIVAHRAVSRAWKLPIGQLRWDPAPIPKAEMTFLQGVQTMTTAGDAGTQAGMAAHIFLITKSMVDQHFYNADGEMLIRAAAGKLALRHRIRPHRCRARRDRGDSARREISRRTHRGPRARLSLRELRRRLHAARARADRRQLPGQCARFPDTGRGLRGQGHADRIVREMGRLAVRDASWRIRRSMWWPGTATTRLTNTICDVSRRSARSASTIPIRRSSRC